MRQTDGSVAVASRLRRQRDGALRRDEIRSVERKQLRAAGKQRDVVGVLRDEAVDRQQIRGDAALDERRIVLIQDHGRQRVGGFAADQARAAGRKRDGGANARESRDDRRDARAAYANRVRPFP